MYWLASLIWHSSMAQASTFMPPQASTFSGAYDTLYTFLVWASLISSLLVIGGLIYFVIKYKRKTDNDKTAYISHDTRLEFLWSFIPFVIFMVVFGWGTFLYLEMRNAPDDAFEVHAIAQKWSWQFAYKSGKNSMNEFYVPVNKPIKMIMTSKDVLHSFYVPAFRVKQDVVPGRYTSLWFEANKLGTFQIFCTEYCGKDHSYMLAKVHVVPEKEFETWLGTDPDAEFEGLSLVDVGAKIYQRNMCFSCHQVTDQALVGPGFKGLFGSQRALADGSTVLADENYLRESILNPNAKIAGGKDSSGNNFIKGVMPSQAGQLTELQMSGLIEYIKSLK